MSSHVIRMIEGWFSVLSIISCDSPVFNAARREMSSKARPGCKALGLSSLIWTQPSGGEGGGEMRNCFSAGGG